MKDHLKIRQGSSNTQTDRINLKQTNGKESPLHMSTLKIITNLLHIQSLNQGKKRSPILLCTLRIDRILNLRGRNIIMS